MIAPMVLVRSGQDVYVVLPSKAARVLLTPSRSCDMLPCPLKPSPLVAPSGRRISQETALPLTHRRMAWALTVWFAHVQEPAPRSASTPVCAAISRVCQNEALMPPSPAV